MAAVTFSWGVTLAVKKKVTGDKEGKAEEEGNKVGDMYKISCHTGGTRIKNKKILSNKLKKKKKRIGPPEKHTVWKPWKLRLVVQDTQKKKKMKRK